jgi:hypothetical protein
MSRMWFVAALVACDDTHVPVDDAGLPDSRVADLGIDACVPGPELCNGIDDDCDGDTDEATNGGRLTRPCHPQPETVGLGRCREGIQACQDARWLACQDPVLPEPERCDGRDQDCDGAIDEAEGGGPLAVACYTGPEGTDGVGVCHGGLAACIDARPVGCEGEVKPAPEVCSGIDEDCDGALDESDDPAPCSVGVGACARDGYLVCVGLEQACDAVPGAPAAETCNDIDDDCDGIVDPPPVCEAFASCKTALDAGRTATGTYRLRPGQDLTVTDVWCDQATDGGGWTLVATSTAPPEDALLPAFDDLRTLVPSGPHPGVWGGLRGLDPRFDVRFACRGSADPQDGPFVVDVSVYAVPWYHEWTRGSDADSCFAVDPIDPAPARRNLRTGAYVDHGVQWASGQLKGEDACNERLDFALDFNDRGLRGNPRDGTDWGLADGVMRCGRPVAGGQWYLFVREASAWQRQDAFRVSDGPGFAPEAGRPWSPPTATACRTHCAQLADAPDAVETFACSSHDGWLDRRAWLDGFSDDAFCLTPAQAPDAFVLPFEGAPYACDGAGCGIYSAWVNDHGCHQENHCWRAEPPPTFVPPAPGSIGSAGARNGALWQVCTADTTGAWLGGDVGPGDLRTVCRAMGYGEIEAVDEAGACGEACVGCAVGMEQPADVAPEGAVPPTYWRCVR